MPMRLVKRFVCTAARGAGGGGGMSIGTCASTAVMPAGAVRRCQTCPKIGPGGRRSAPRALSGIPTPLKPGELADGRLSDEIRETAR